MADTTIGTPDGPQKPVEEVETPDDAKGPQEIGQLIMEQLPQEAPPTSVPQ